jgi:hypothetical protein
MKIKKLKLKDYFTIEEYQDRITLRVKKNQKFEGDLTFCTDESPLGAAPFIYFDRRGRKQLSCIEITPLQNEPR